MGELFVFEGPDFSGKTSCIKIIEKRLKEKGYKVFVTKEPGGTPLGLELRQILLEKDYNLNQVTEAYLFAADRTEHNLIIKQYIENDYIVLCDRHALSSYVYQKDCNSFDINLEANKQLEGIEKSIILFNISPEESLKRKQKRINEINKIDLTITKEKIMELNKLYIEKMNLHCCDYHKYIISADFSINEVANNIEEIIMNKFKEDK